MEGRQVLHEVLYIAEREVACFAGLAKLRLELSAHAGSKFLRLAGALCGTRWSRPLSTFSSVLIPLSRCALASCCGRDPVGLPTLRRTTVRIFEEVPVVRLQ